MGAQNEFSNKFRRHIAGFFIVLWCHGIFSCACSPVRFGVSDLEHTGDARALLALCYRAQKEFAAGAGGNTRNCDDVQGEAIKFVRHQVCIDDMPDKKGECFYGIYKIRTGE